jgi:TolB protein
VLGAAAALTCVCASPSLAQTPVERSLVALTVTADDGHGEIFLMRSDGSERRRLTGGNVPLTSGGVSSTQPAWSPDGSRLAFAQGGSDEGEAAIAVLDVASGTTRKLTSGKAADGYPAWSPDGTRVAFARSDDDSGATSIWIVRADGSGEPQQLVRGSRYRLSFAPAWSPDGSRIAFSRIVYRVKAERIEQEAYVIDADGSGAHSVASDARSPAWSPDGARLAFLSARDRNGETCFEDCGPNNEVYVMNADGSAQRRLTRTSGDEENPDWSPDGLRIAFDSDRNSPLGSDGGGRELYSIGADGACMTWLSNGGASSVDPAWQPGRSASSDPGPGCGAVPRPPTADISLGGLRPVGGDRFPLYWLGPTFGSALLSGVSLDGPLYGDCASYRAGDCPRRIQLQNASTCERDPFWYARLPVHRFAYQGAIVARYPGEDGGWDIYTGHTAVALFGVGKRPGDIRRVVRALRPVESVEVRAGPLAPPRFPPAFWRKLERFERVARRAGVPGAARALRVTPAAVRDKLSLGRLLRREGAGRRAACS